MLVGAAGIRLERRRVPAIYRLGSKMGRAVMESTVYLQAELEAIPHCGEWWTIQRELSTELHSASMQRLAILETVEK